ncbi:MAG: (Fe-S)-binding protein [Myxococcales bacterium]|nr:(Fe-S)-binding protein [Myxococcales bacterium]
MKQFLFAALLFASLAFFARTVTRLTKFLLKGRPDARFDRWPERAWSVLIYFFGQAKVGEAPSYDALKKGITSKHHLWIFWGFLLITFGTVELWANGIVPSFNFSFLGAGLYGVIKASIDAMNLIVLAMIVYAFIRRIFLKPRLIPMNLDAGLILGMIGLLMISHFVYHAYHFVGEGAIEPWAESWSVSGWLARRIGVYDPSEGFATVAQVGWWVHVVTLLVFMNYIPFSKHIHLLGALPNILFRNLDERIVGTRRNLEDETDYGVGTIEQFTWKQLLDGYACTECARCSNFCPAYNTEKPLSPMQIIHDMKAEMIERGDLEMKIARLEKQPHPIQALIDQAKRELDEMAPLVGGRIKDETLWACTTCGACQEVCPVFIEHPRAIVDMRTWLVLSESRMPAELQRTFTNLERNSNPWGIGADQRMNWAEGLSVPTIAETPDAEYLLFVGCAGAFDDRIKKSMRALVQLLQAAKVSYAVLGAEEQCTGDPARRSGNEYLFQTQAQANVDLMNRYKVTKVISSCPHCFHTIRNEYPQFGGKYEVIHHSQLLAHLIESKRLLPMNPVTKNFTYHDSCYLGRWNGEYDAPRKVLESIPGSGGLIELGRKKEHGFCCGGGGGRMWMEEKIGTRVNRNRTDEILATGAQIAAVACPYCTIMITDGVKDAGAEERIEVLDIAEVLIRSIPNILKNPNPPVPYPARDTSND